jgi:Ser/Thr protein kinase RdoA (MazF antagonist)
MIQTVLSAYGFKDAETRMETFGTGLINYTWKITTAGKSYILQKINHSVFKQPGDIASNIRLIADYLKKLHPDYLFVGPVAAMSGEHMVFIEGEGFFRLFPFIRDSHTIDVVKNPEQAYEAAVQFGKFTRLLSGIDIRKLKITIRGFHNLTLRYQQFTDALKNGNKNRINESKDLINTITEHAGIVAVYEKIKADPSFHLRVTHHDTKISNVLFDKNDKGLCVIDLDTVMPGYFFSDTGDMVRTYLSPVSEEEADLNKITIREDFYKAIEQGYMDEMKDELTGTEKKYFFYAGQFMTYMQALRFLTDYISNDIYYGERYPGHNLVRARNQMTFLNHLLEKETVLR